LVMARTTFRPIRPNPLMAIRTGMASPLSRVEVCMVFRSVAGPGQATRSSYGKARAKVMASTAGHPAPPSAVAQATSVAPVVSTSSTNITGGDDALTPAGGADATNANLRGANLKGANLKGTILRGADLRDARNLTSEQLAEAIIDERTLLPSYLSSEDLPRQREGAL